MPEKLLRGRSGGKCQAQALDKQQKWHAPTFEVHEETVVKRRPGRPRKDAPPPTCQKFRVHLIIPQPDSGKLQAERRRRSTFVLGTDDQCLGARELLETYKGQDQAERGFRMDERRPAPRCLLCPKAGSRRRDRHAARARATTRALRSQRPRATRPPDKRDLTAPSDRVVIESLAPIWVAKVRHQDREWYQWAAVPPHSARVLQALGTNLDDIFSAPT